MSDARTSARVSRDELLEIYRDTRRIAVVGASANPGKPAHDVPKYLQEQGYELVPVNPRGGEILGVPAVASLAEVEGPIDVVDVFRPPEEAEDVARAAIKARPRVLWFQPGTHTKEAVRLAQEAGLTVVAKRCLRETHRELGLGPDST